MSGLAQREQELIDALRSQPSAQDRLAWLVEQARKRSLLPVDLRTDEHRVEGCLSKLWFVPEMNAGRCVFRTESDSLIVKAVAGALCDVFSSATPGEISAHPAGALARLGLQQHLTTNRRAGLGRVEDRIRAFAAGRRGP